MKLAIIAFLPALTSIGCAATPDSRPTTAVVDNLRNAGVVIEDAGIVEQPFFPVSAHVYRVDGDDLQVYEFATPAEAEAAAAQVSPNGGAIGTTMMHWMAPPHFFRKDRLIVNYLGNSPKVMGELQRLLGAQFAGQ
jgi:hypothetical protein